MVKSVRIIPYTSAPLPLNPIKYLPKDQTAPSPDTKGINHRPPPKAEPSLQDVRDKITVRINNNFFIIFILVVD